MNYTPQQHSQEKEKSNFSVQKVNYVSFSFMGINKRKAGNFHLFSYTKKQNKENLFIDNQYIVFLYFVSIV